MSGRSIWTPANVVTMVRICLVPVFVVALLSPWPEWLGMHDLVSDHVKSLLAAAVFILISCTDWIDGYLARSRGEVTDFGKLIDPLADKILVAAALLALIELQVLPSWPVLIILAREFIVSGVRMLAASRGIIIAASWYGKAKTVLQIAAIVMFLIKDPMSSFSTAGQPASPLYVASWAVMIAALVLTVLSMVDYVSKAWPLIVSAEDSVEEDGIEERIRHAAASVIDGAVAHGFTISTAESLTGGMISTNLTAIPGSSRAYLGGVVGYDPSVKASLLGVSSSLLEERGAVDAEVARQMAAGAARDTGSDLAVSVTGIAGPGGAMPGMPVGTVYLGAFCEGSVSATRLQLTGDRDRIRELTTLHALKALDQMMANGRRNDDGGAQDRKASAKERG